MEDRKVVSGAFIFDATAVLDRIVRARASPPSQECRNTDHLLPDENSAENNTLAYCNKYKKLHTNTSADGSESQLTQLSPVSQHRLRIAALTVEQRCSFEERAAIKEYDAGMSRAEAEHQAMLGFHGSVGAHQG